MLASQLLTRCVLLMREIRKGAPWALPMTLVTVWLLVDSTGIASWVASPCTLVRTVGVMSWDGNPLPMKIT